MCIASNDRDSTSITTASTAAAPHEKETWTFKDEVVTVAGKCVFLFIMHTGTPSGTEEN